MVTNVNYRASTKANGTGTSYFAVGGKKFSVKGDWSTPEALKELNRLLNTGGLQKDPVFPFSAPRAWEVDGVVQTEQRADHPRYGQPIMLDGCVNLVPAISASMQANIDKLTNDAMGAYVDNTLAKEAGTVFSSAAEQTQAKLDAMIAERKAARAAALAASVVTPAEEPVGP